MLPALAGVWDGAVSADELLEKVAELEMAEMSGAAGPSTMIPSPANDLFGKNMLNPFMGS